MFTIIEPYREAIYIINRFIDLNVDVKKVIFSYMTEKIITNMLPSGRKFKWRSFLLIGLHQIYYYFIWNVAEWQARSLAGELLS